MLSNRLRPVIFLTLITSWLSVNTSASIEISKISVDKQAFNPTEGEQVIISYTLSQTSRITLNIYDKLDKLVKTFSKEQQAGKQKQIWDGKDESGKIVPDEAYRFTLEAEDDLGNKTRFDRTEATRGKFVAAKNISIDSKKGVFHYILSKPARVRVRIGVKHGPLLRTLLDWQPRPKGKNEEPWDGKDQSGVVTLSLSYPFLYQDVSAYSLPANSMIATGNHKLTWAEYQQGREKTPTRSKSTDVKATHPHAKHPISQCKAPDFRISLTDDLPRAAKGVPIVSGSCSERPLRLSTSFRVTVELYDEDRDWLTKEGYEIAFFVDNVFVSEEEKGDFPFVWTWDLQNIKKGEHVITVNILGYLDHIGTQSLKILVKM